MTSQNRDPSASIPCWRPKGGPGAPGAAFRVPVDPIYLVALAWLFFCGCVATSAGDRLLEADRPDEAVMAYSRVRGEDAAFHRKLGLAFFRAGLPAAAQRELLRARELAPADPTAVFWLGQLATEFGDPATARAYWGEYVRLRPGVRASAPGAGTPADGPIWEAFRLAEETAVIHPERVRGRRLLESMSGRLAGPGLSTTGENQWDPRVSDAEAWALGAVGLPDFPPPPGFGR